MESKKQQENIGFLENPLTQSQVVFDILKGLQNIEENFPTKQIINHTSFEDSTLKIQDMCFYRVEQLSYDEDYPYREAFENVLLSLDNTAYNFVYILTGTSSGIELCIGVVKNKSTVSQRDKYSNGASTKEYLSAVNYGEIAAKLFEGNFSGSKLKRMMETELQKTVVDSVQKYTSAGMITGIPSIRESISQNKFDFQGIDRLINSMLGLEWRLEIICEPVSKKEIQKVQEEIYRLYNTLSIYAKQTMQSGINSGYTMSAGKNESDSKGYNWGYNQSDSHAQETSKSKSSGESSQSSGSNQSHQEGRSEGQSQDHSEGNSTNIGQNWNKSASMTIEIGNKHAQELMKYIDEELMERLKIGFSRGLFKTSVYYMAKSPTQANRLKGSILSLFQGSKSTYSPLQAHHIDLAQNGNKRLLCSYQNQYIKRTTCSDNALLLMGIPFRNNCIGLQTYLTSGEVSLLAGLPQKEVPGLPMREGVSFGLNMNNTDSADSIDLGVMVQRGRDLEASHFQLMRDCLAKHTFVAGVTGSGKTTTCHRLLSEAHIPFLVIEPAKTEYRKLLRKDPDLVVFTLGNESVAPFRLNPFELVEGEVISAHIDMIKATFTSAFPMEASMPQLLEEAIYQCYEQLGWNVNGKYNPKDALDFPTLSNLLETLSQVVKNKRFSQRLEGDYIGSLVSRLSNLTKGVKGAMLNCQVSTDFHHLVKHNVILEMEQMKSPEDKALFMGFILSRLSAVIHFEYEKDHCFKHLTLIEEAHRLLSRIEYGDSGSKKVAVEIFTDLLAEVRKYGEGLIIVDQIPNKLAPEVLKNTNTKIIHKLLARDDKETVGDTMLMDDKQKEYLSALEVGYAIIFCEQTDKPVQVHISYCNDMDMGQDKEDVLEVDVMKRFSEKRSHLGKCYEFQEITDSLLKEFCGVVQMLRRVSVDKKCCENLRQHVKDAAWRSQKSIKEIWRYLICIRDEQTGKSAGSPKDREERKEFLTEFFSETFCKPNFSESDLPGIYQIKFYTYLL